MDKGIVIGKIVSAQGIKGEVKVLPFTDDPERFNRLDKIHLLKDDNERIVHIQSSRIQKNVVVIAFSEIQDRNEAESLKDWELVIEQQDLQPLPEGRFYIFQLVGLTVFTMDRRELGILSEVLQTGANDVYVVKDALGNEKLVPALKSVVKKIDLEAKEMWIDPLPGLLD